MASIGNKMTSEKFEEYLIDFSEENKVNIDIAAIMTRLKSARKELEDDMEAYHSFYSDFAKYIEKDSNTIDSTGNVNSAILNTFTKNKKIEIQYKNEQKRKEETQKNNSYSELENNKLSSEEIKEKIENMDFRQLTFSDLKTLLDNYEEAEKVMTEEQKETVTRNVGTILGADEDLITLLNIAEKYKNNDYKLTEDDKNILEQISPEKLKDYNIDINNFEETFSAVSSEFLQVRDAQQELLRNIITIIEENGKISSKEIELLLSQPKFDIFKKIPNAINKEQLLSRDFSKADIESELIKLNKERYNSAINEDVAKNGQQDFVRNSSFQNIFRKERYVLENMLEILRHEKDFSRDDILNILERIGIEAQLDQEFLGVSIEDFCNGKIGEEQLQDLLNQFETESKEQVEEGIFEEQSLAEDSEVDYSLASKAFKDIMENWLDIENVEEKFETKLQDENSKIVEEIYTKNAIEYYKEEIKQIDIDKEKKNTDLQKDELEEVQYVKEVRNLEENIEDKQEERNEQAKEEADPLVEESKQEEEYEAPTFDEEEKTGLAGLVAAIANSRIGRAVKSLFKTKDAQKRLNAPVTQRTEDGLKITEYESNGSLMPTTIQARNFFRDFAVNTVEAVTNFTKNISNAIRGNQDEVINRPTIIKSESVQKRYVVEKNTDKNVLLEKSIINQENAFDRYVKLNPEAQSNFDQNAAIIVKNAAQVATMSKAQTPNQNTQNKDENEGIEY